MSQENKNILLSNQARALSVPSLEVLTNDVHCFHGSALGRFDQNHLFYAASRGIDEIQMRTLLVRAFFGDMFADQRINELVQELV
jgi:Fe-S cluster assembly protein SufD